MQLHGMAHAGSSVVFTPEEREWLDNHSSITVAFDGYFPPYSFLNDNHQLEGFAVDVFSLLSQKTGLNINLHPQYEWRQLYDSAKKHHIDVVATMVERDQRRRWFNFTEPFIQKSLVVITRADDVRIDHKDDLPGMKVALVKDYQYIQSILQNYPSIIPVYVNTLAEALHAVSFGEADATVTFLGAGHFYRTKYLLSNLKYAALYDGNGSPESIAVRKDNPLLVSIINKALLSISEATLQSLREKWLPIEYIDQLVEIELSAEEKEWIKRHPVIYLGVDPEFAPFEFIENGRYQGITSDYVRLLNQRLNLNMELRQGLSWKRVIDKVKQREVDVLPAVGKNQQRQKFLNYTAAYLKFHRVIVSLNDAPFIAGIDDLKHRRVAVQVDSSHHGYLKEHSSIQPVTYSTLKEALLALSGGEVDAFVGNVASTSYWIRKLNLSNLKVAAPVSKEVQNLHFATRKDWPELAIILQKGLDSISAKQHAEIAEKWTSVEFGNPFDKRLMIQVAALVIVFFTAVFVWNLQLKRKVRLQTAQILRHAHYDQLTELPNRFLIQDRLNQRINEAKQLDSNVAMLSVDLDEFKRINDSYGHVLGDFILKEVAVRISGSLKDGDTLGRLSGDQFLIILCDSGDSAEVAAIAQEITALFARPFQVDGRDFILSASIGIAIYPFDGDTPLTLLKNADSATHHAKTLLAGSYAFYTETLNQKVARQLKVEEALRGALAKQEIQVFYQPKVDAKTKRVVSFEALLRWKSSALGDISPLEFIPIAEKTGDIEALGLFVIDQALAFLARLQGEGDNCYSMAVNMSPVQLRGPDIIEYISNRLNNYGVDADCLEIEITEGVLMGNYPDAGHILNSLTAMGVKLAMDDFGTGYSSMSNLRRFTFNTLKIDREFIGQLPEDQSDCQLVSATISMAHGLGMKVVAEGVETTLQSQYLINNNCDYLQGWLFGRPVASEEILRRLL